MITITLPEHLAGSHLVAGIEFVDGIAVVATLGHNTQHYFALIGANIDDAPTAVARSTEDPAPQAEAEAPKPRGQRKPARKES